MLRPRSLGVLVLAAVAFLAPQILNPYAFVRAQQPDDSQNQNTARGVQLYQQGDTAGAISVLNKVVKKHPNDADAWYYLGLAFNREGTICKARPAFEHLLKLRPDSADAQAKLSYALILANEPVQAMATAKRAIELGDQSPEPHYALAEASLSFRVREAEKAVEEADLALKINPGFLPALVTKSLALYYLKQYADAAASLERLLAISPNDADADVWRVQLEELRLRATQSLTEKPPTETAIFNSRGVTQKVRVQFKPEPTYTEAARKAGVEGTVILAAVFTSDGEVRHILIKKALGYGLTTQAIKAARRMKFSPAIKEGRQVSMYMQLEYNFNLY